MSNQSGSCDSVDSSEVKIQTCSKNPIAKVFKMLDNLSNFLINVNCGGKKVTIELIGQNRGGSEDEEETIFDEQTAYGPDYDPYQILQDVIHDASMYFEDHQDKMNFLEVYAYFKLVDGGKTYSFDEIIELEGA